MEGRITSAAWGSSHWVPSMTPLMAIKAPRPDSHFSRWPRSNLLSGDWEGGVLVAMAAPK